MSINRSQLLALLSPVLSPLDDAVLLCDRHGAVLFSNPANCRLLAVDPDQPPATLGAVGGTNLRQALMRAGLRQDDEQPDDDRHHCDREVNFEEAFTIAGEPRWLRIHSRLLDIPCVEGQVRMVVLRDITAERRLEAVLNTRDGDQMQTRDPAMRQLLERLRAVAASGASVLFQGESGTGKTSLARLTHQHSPRHGQPFVEVNCGAIPGSLIESELFGHVKGAFTGAIKARPGRFKAADGGTLFLDEISELPRELQAKLLRALESGEFEPVGSDHTTRVDVRILTASNQNLRDLVDQGEFRADLYYRIAVVPLVVPPLRDRPADIPHLIEHFARRHVDNAGANHGASPNASPNPGPIVSHAALQPLMNYPWPGNIRELANAVEHSAILAGGGTIGPEHLPYAVQEYCSARRRSAPEPEDDPRRRIELALTQANGNRTLAAEILGMDRSTLWRQMRRLGMD